MSVMRLKDDRLTLRISTAVKAAIEAEAEKERRSVAGMAVLLIEDALAARRKGTRRG
jgi:hypothetical protein